MIGLPEEEGDRPVLPQPVGMAELLHKRRYTLDRYKKPGNIHYEEYW